MTKQFADYTKISCFITVTGYASSSALETYQASNTKTVWAGVVFDESATYAALPQDITYSLRVSLLSGETNWRTDRTYAFTVTSSPRNDDKTGGEPCT